MFALIISIISTMVFIYFKELMIKEIGKSRIDVLRQIGERTNSIKKSVITISNLYSINPHVYTTLKSDDPELLEKDTKDYLDKIKSEYDLVFKEVGVSYYVTIIGNNGFNYSSYDGNYYNYEGLKSQLWYKKVLESNGDIYFVSSFRDYFGEDKTKYVFSAARVLKDSNGDILGTLLINVNERHLAETYKSVLNGNNSIYIIDEKGNVVSHTKQDMCGMNFINTDNFKKLYGENSYNTINKSSGDYLITNYYDNQTGWTIIEEMPSRIIFSELYAVLWILGIVIITCLSISLIVAFYISREISKPILNLCNSMDEVKKGNFDVLSDIEGFDEINKLKDGFNQMTLEIKKLLEDIRRQEFYKRKVELDFLRAQINPHFLYNTLFSIRCLVGMGKNEQASDMIIAFIDLLKMTLNVDSKLILLSDEFTSTEKYLNLQKFRYSDKISFECEIDERTKNCLVPALILQPIVENSLFHGIEAKNDGGTIIVESEIKDNKLIISIIDDGIGMTSDAIQDIMEKCGNKEYGRNSMVGIANIDNRIKINFGEEYGISINSEVNIGTTVTLTLPVIY